MWIRKSRSSGRVAAGGTGACISSAGVQTVRPTKQARGSPYPLIRRTTMQGVRPEARLSDFAAFRGATKS